MLDELFRYRHGVVPNVAALAYTLVGYAAGVWLLFAERPLLAFAGVLLTAHALTLSAYFVHEFAHQSVFRSPQANQRWGTLMSWINGSCYAPFAALRRKHMRHHLERADVLTFDFKKFLRASPVWFQRLVIAAEWA
jgi:fatty acid desaturase